MSGVSVLGVDTACALTLLTAGFSMLCGFRFSPLCVCANNVTPPVTLTHTYTDTSARPLTLLDICPGVEYLINLNKPRTVFLQVNVSDCKNNLPDDTFRQGVVYGVCQDFTSFCKLHIKTNYRKRVRAVVQRLEYWCNDRHWKTGIYRLNTYARLTSHRNIIMQCNHHGVDKLFTGFDSSWLYIEQINRPQVKMLITVIKEEHFIVNYTAAYTGYVITPYVNWIPGRLKYRTEWKVSSGNNIMISLQQITTLERYASQSSSDDDTKFLQLTIPQSNTTKHAVKRMCISCPLSARVLLTTSLHIQFFTGYDYTSHAGLKMYLTPLPKDKQHVQLPNGLFNCSVSSYCEFQQHLHCNLQPQCEGGQDETEHCPFSSPHCQGLVASHYKCFQFLYMDIDVLLTLAQYECQRKGGRPASIKTRREQEGFRKIFKDHVNFRVTMGIKSEWHSLPFVYSIFRKWSDNTMIYNVDHFIVGYKYVPSRSVQYIDVQSMVFKHAVQSTRSIMCEVKVQPQRALDAYISLAPLYSDSVSALSDTSQSLKLCENRKVTHVFILCDSKGRQWQSNTLLNVSNAQNTDLHLHGTPSGNAYIFFECSGKTLHHTLLCDFKHDCLDKSDESFCEHPPCSGFLCSVGQCVLLSQRCNQYSDCLDDSDEVGCSENSSYLAWFKDEEKKHLFYVNLDGAGYFTQQVMSADDPCPHSHYRCTAEWLYCLPVYTRCNGFSDCVYGEDEQGCETMTCSGFYQCQASSICVHAHHLCDGWGQCPQRDDELMCDMTCPEGCLCQGHVFLCSSPFSPDLFRELRYLDATGSNMSLTDFNANTYLTVLILSHCSLHNVSLTKLPNLRFLDLAHNYLRTVNITVLLNLPSLGTVHLQNNPLSEIGSELANHVLHELRQIDISKTSLNIFYNSLSIYLPQVTFLNISFCTIETIGPTGFKNIPQIQEVDIRGNPISNFPVLFLSKLDKVQRIFSSNFRLCCKHLLPQLSTAVKCITPYTVLPSCTTLIPTDMYRIFFWIIGIVAIMGNSVCLVASRAFVKIFAKNFVTLIAHLQVANMCMGSHIIIVMLANLMYDGKYLHVEKAWTSSAGCQLAGFLSFLSSTVSVLMISVVILYHITILCFPMHSERFNRSLTATVCVFMWIAGLLLAGVPFLPGLSHWGLQGQSGLCHLALFQSYHSRSQFRWFTVIVSVNCIWCVAIVAGQAVMYRRTPKYRVALSPTQRSVFSSVHVMGNVAITDALCWFAFGLAAIVSSYDVTVFRIIYDTMVVFVLPFNSALNPLLYLWTARTQWLGQQQEDRLLNVLKLRLAQNQKK